MSMLCGLQIKLMKFCCKYFTKMGKSNFIASKQKKIQEVTTVSVSYFMTRFELPIGNFCFRGRSNTTYSVLLMFFLCCDNIHLTYPISNKGITSCLKPNVPHFKWKHSLEIQSYPKKKGNHQKIMY